MKKSKLCLSVTIAVFLFLYLPILLLMIHSFNDSRFAGLWKGFTLKWYAKLFSDTAVWEALVNSLIIGVSSTIVSTITGTLAAFALYRYHSTLQKVHFTFIYAPLMIPDVLIGISLLLFFVALNVQLGLFTIFIAHTTFCVSYVTMLMLSKLQNFDFSLVEAAQDMGANMRIVIYRIVLPLITPAIVAAALLSFTLSIDDFVITFFVAGDGVVTLPLYIYGMIKFGSTPIINALCTLILAITFILVWLYRTFSKEEVL